MAPSPINLVILPPLPKGMKMLTKPYAGASHKDSSSKSHWCCTGVMITTIRICSSQKHATAGMGLGFLSPCSLRHTCDHTPIPLIHPFLGLDPMICEHNNKDLSHFSLITTAAKLIGNGQMGKALYCSQICSLCAGIFKFYCNYV